LPQRDSRPATQHRTNLFEAKRTNERAPVRFSGSACNPYPQRDPTTDIRSRNAPQRSECRLQLCRPAPTGPEGAI